MANLSTRCRYGKRLLSIAGAVSIVVSSSLPAAAAAAAPAPFSSTAQYARVLRSFNPHLSRFQSGTLANHVRTEALFYRLDPRLLVALVAIESSWHPYATSPVGAGGLGQLMPGTAAGLGVNAYSPYANLNGTARYLRGLLNRFSAYSQRTRYAYALAGYNAGPGAVIRFGGVPPYAETQNYVRNVLGVWQRLTLSLSAHIDNFARAPVSMAVAARAPSAHLSPTARIVPHIERPAVVARPAARPPQTTGPWTAFNADQERNGRLRQSEERPPLAVALPGRVKAGQAIAVRFSPIAVPAVLVTSVGSTVLGRTLIAAHTRSARIPPVPALDNPRLLTVRLVAVGYATATAQTVLDARGGATMGPEVAFKP